MVKDAAEPRVLDCLESITKQGRNRRRTMVPRALSAKAIRDEPSPTERLRLLPGFALFSARLMEKLARGMLIESIQPKTVLIQEGEAPRSLFVLFDGMLQEFVGRGTHETTLAIIAAPALVQPHALYRQSAACASIRAVRASSVGRISMSYARRLLADEAQFAATVVDQIVTEFEGLFSEYKNSRTRTGLQRLAAWVIAMQHEVGAGASITLPYDKAMLAARLGVAPATLSRDFAMLEHYGVTIRGRALTIDNQDLLSSLTAIDPLNTPPVP